MSIPYLVWYLVWYSDEYTLLSLGTSRCRIDVKIKPLYFNYAYDISIKFGLKIHQCKTKNVGLISGFYTIDLHQKT